MRKELKKYELEKTIGWNIAIIKEINKFSVEIETKDKLEEINSQKTHLETVLAAHTGSWLKEIQIGTKLDAKDKFGRWYEGTIIAMHGNDQVRVHFDGWNSNFDELMVKSSERLAPLHLHSIKEFSSYVDYVKKRNQNKVHICLSRFQ